MDVAIENRDSPDDAFVKQYAGGHCQVVENAEPGAELAMGMVGAAGELGGEARLQCDASGRETAANGGERTLLQDFAQGNAQTPFGPAVERSAKN